MKKIFVLIVLLTLIFACLFGEGNVHTYFPSLLKKAIFPVDADIGQCADSVSEEHIMLKKAFSEKYSFEWTEKYIHENVRKNLASIYSSLLSEILPTSEVLFSKAKINSDHTVVITAKFIESNKIISFAVKDNLICAILN